MRRRAAIPYPEAVADADVEAAVDALDAALLAAGDPARAPQEQRYLKSTLRHYGTSMPAMRRVLTAWRAPRSPFERATLRAFVDEAWRRGVHELRNVAVEQLVDDVRLLTPEDLPWLEGLLRGAKTWALVDPLAVQVLGPLTQTYPHAAATVATWAGDPDHWLRRSALLVHLLPMRRGEPGAFAPFVRVAEPLLEEHEFFIRKAIGWVLRERAKRCPDEVFAWLLEHAPRASGLTLREATKPLTVEQRARVVIAHRRAR
jgi:3-methyladenine DNA glycosylase AlkD